MLKPIRNPIGLNTTRYRDQSQSLDEAGEKWAVVITEVAHVLQFTCLGLPV